MLPPVAEAHAQSLGLLSLLALQGLNLLLLHLPVNLQLFVSQTHRGHTAKARTSYVGAQVDNVLPTECVLSLTLKMD